MQKLFDFKCSPCNFKFETWATNESASEGVACPSCKAISQRHYGKMSFSFKEGPPGPTGTDKLVGFHAQKSWEVMEARKAEKDKLRKQTQTDYLVRTNDGYHAGNDKLLQDTKVAANEYDKIAKTIKNTKVTTEAK